VTVPPHADCTHALSPLYGVVHLSPPLPPNRTLNQSDSYPATVLTRPLPLLCRPDAEIVRTEGLDRSEEMISRLRTRLHFLEREEGSHHIVFLDAGMLVVRNLNHVFAGEEPFDVAATWRHSRRDPVSGGILFVHKARLERTHGFFTCEPQNLNKILHTIFTLLGVCPRGSAPRSPRHGSTSLIY
jgi:hypothetical protein